MSWSVTDTDLHDFMTEAGEVKSAEVIKYPDGRSKVPEPAFADCPHTHLNRPLAVLSQGWGCAHALVPPQDAALGVGRMWMGGGRGTWRVRMSGHMWRRCGGQRRQGMWGKGGWRE